MQDAIETIVAVLDAFLHGFIGDTIPSIPTGWDYTRQEWED